jgi:hypothetical protein
VGIRPEDFILKPVRHTELIDWLALRLALRWQYEAAPAVAVVAPQRRVWPDAPQLAALRELVNLGFYRGILNKLAEIETQQPATSGFIDDMRLLARQFQFDAMSCQLTHPEADHGSRA